MRNLVFENQINIEITTKTPTTVHWVIWNQKCSQNGSHFDDRNSRFKKFSINSYFISLRNFTFSLISGLCQFNFLEISEKFHNFSLQKILRSILYVISVAFTRVIQSFQSKTLRPNCGTYEYACSMCECFWRRCSKSCRQISRNCLIWRAARGRKNSGSD